MYLCNMIQFSWNELPGVKKKFKVPVAEYNPLSRDISACKIK